MIMKSHVALTSALLLAAGLQTHMALAQAVTASATPGAPAQAQPAPALHLQGRTELPGYSGDFDHFEVDIKGNRLFLAAEDHDTLEVFALDTGAHLKTVKGFNTPHGLLYLPEQNRMIVTQSGGDGMTKILDTKTYRIVGSIKLTKGADAFGYDAARKRMYIATGGKDGKMKDSFLSEVDPVTGKHLGDIKFDTDKIEAMAIEQNGNRLYINVTGKNYLAVIDKPTRKVVATWPIREAEKNAPLAFDEANRRLFVVTRQPGKLIVVNADTGASVMSFKAPERADQVLFDEATRRVYVLGGEGYIGVFQQRDADHYEELAHVPSAVGAKTGILVPDLKRLYVAVSPGEGKTGAAVLRFDVASGK
jgi:DNA-binding beta-propeller fold protein YncE